MINSINKTLPEHLLDDIKNQNMPLSNCPSFMPNSIEKLTSKSFNEIINNFSDDITSYPEEKVLNALSRLTSKCIKREQKILDNLKQLCLRIINESFNVPQEGIEISCELQTEIPNTQQFHIDPENNEDYEYDDVKSIEDSDSEIEKRKFLNALITGMALKISEELRKKYLSSIFELDEELPHLYNKIMAINNYLIFVKKIDIKDNDHKQGGYVETVLGNDITNSKINSYGIIFPIMLYETVKGCLELFISHGLPDDKGTAESIIGKADALKNDPWYMRIGPSLYNFSVPCEYVPNFLMYLSEIPINEFFSITKEIVVGTKKGKEIIEELIIKSQSDDFEDYSDDNTLQDKSDKDLIEDDYFSEEEIDKW